MDKSLKNCGYRRYFSIKFCEFIINNSFFYLSFFSWFCYCCISCDGLIMIDWKVRREFLVNCGCKNGFMLFCEFIFISFVFSLNFVLGLLLLCPVRWFDAGSKDWDSIFGEL